MRLAKFEETNRMFTVVVIGFGGVLNSIVSFLFWTAFFWAVPRLIQGIIVWPRHHKIRMIGLTFALYFAANGLSSLLNYEDASTFLEIGALLPFLGFLFVYARLTLSERSDTLRAVEIGVFLGSLSSLAFALFQTFVEGELRAEGFAGNPGPFALIMAMLYGLALLAMLRRGQRNPRLAAIAAFAAAGALILSGMRTLWPMLVLAPAVAMLFHFALSRARIRPLVIFTAAGVGLLGLLGSEILEDRFERLFSDYDRILSQSDFDNSVGHRLLVWSSGLEKVAEKPVFGHGPTRANIILPSVGPEHRELVFSHYHNFVIDALVHTGVVGLAATLAMLLLPAWLAFREDRDELGDAGFAMMLMVLLAYVLSGTFNIMLGHDILDAVFIYGIIASSFLVWDRGEAALARPAAPAMAMAA